MANQQGRSFELSVGSFEHDNPRCQNEPIGQNGFELRHMKLVTAMESVVVQPGCSLTLWQEGPRHPYQRHFAPRWVYRFTENGSTNLATGEENAAVNNDFSVANIRNANKSYDCSCDGIPVEYPLACEPNEPNCLNGY